jgi:hypothetical protein
MRHLLPLLILVTGAGCQDGTPGLEVTLKLTDPVYAATASARIVLSSTDGTSFHEGAMATSIAQGLSVRNLDIDGDGAVDVVLDLGADYPFAKSQRFLLTPSGIDHPVNVSLRAEIYDGLNNRLAKLGGASRDPAAERVAAIVNPGQHTQAQDLQPACLGTCPDATARLGSGDAMQVIDGGSDAVTGLAAGNLTGAVARRADLAVARAHQARPGQAGGVPRPNAGEVAVYFGGGTLTLQSTILGTQSGDQLGTAVAIGDLDGDGADDLVIGAPGYAESRGAVFVLRGGANWPTTMDLADTAAPLPWTGATPGDRLGASLALLDVDGDGKLDVVAGAPGAAAVYAMSIPPMAGSDVSARPSVKAAASSQFGASLAALGDNIAVGAPGETGGAAYLLDRTRDFAQPGTAAPAQARTTGQGGSFGASVTVADLGSGPLLVVGAPDDGAGAIYGFPTGHLDAPVQVVRSSAPATQLGAALERIHRPLGDALFLGAPSLLPSSSPGAGSAYLLRGPMLSVLPTFALGADGQPAAAVLSGGKDGDSFGSAAAIGDFNGDGLDDLAVAAAAAHTITVFAGPLL